MSSRYFLRTIEARFMKSNTGFTISNRAYYALFGNSSELHCEDAIPLQKHMSIWACNIRQVICIFESIKFDSLVGQSKWRCCKVIAFRRPMISQFLSIWVPPDRFPPYLPSFFVSSEFALPAKIISLQQTHLHPKISEPFSRFESWSCGGFT